MPKTQRNINWGKVEENDRFNIQIGLHDEDTYPNKFTCKVRLKDKLTDRVHVLGGHGEFCGNFSPVWVAIKSEGEAVQFKSGHNFRRKQGRTDEANGWKFVQLTELGRMPLDPTLRKE